MDIPNAPFGIQRLTLEGLSFDKYIGEWFGPLAICNSIQAIWGTLNFSRDIGLIVSSDGSIPSSALKEHESCLLLIATRLGVEFINSTYYETIKVTATLATFSG